MNKSTSMKEICQEIADDMNKRHGTHYTAKQIWESSPRGELSHILEYHAQLHNAKYDFTSGDLVEWDGRPISRGN